MNLLFVKLHQCNEQIQLITFWSTRSGVHQFVDTCKRTIIRIFCSNDFWDHYLIYSYPLLSFKERNIGFETHNCRYHPSFNPPICVARSAFASACWANSINPSRVMSFLF